jgi:hypothetical protein
VRDTRSGGNIADRGTHTWHGGQSGTRRLLNQIRGRVTGHVTGNIIACSRPVCQGHGLPHCLTENLTLGSVVSSSRILPSADGCLRRGVLDDLDRQARVVIGIAPPISPGREGREHQWAHPPLSSQGHGLEARRPHRPGTVPPGTAHHTVPVSRREGRCAVLGRSVLPGTGAGCHRVRTQPTPTHGPRIPPASRCMIRAFRCTWTLNPWSGLCRPAVKVPPCGCRRGRPHATFRTLAAAPGQSAETTWRGSASNPAAKSCGKNWTRKRGYNLAEASPATGTYSRLKWGESGWAMDTPKAPTGRSGSTQKYQPNSWIARPLSSTKKFSLK